MIGRAMPAGDLDTSAMGSRISGAEYAKQKIRQRLLFILGEWILDTRLGVPWFEEILVKNPDLRLIQARIRDVILSVPGMVNVQKAEAAVKDRNLSLAYIADYRDSAGSATLVSDLVTSGIA
jgi:hypothetical protein